MQDLRSAAFVFLCAAVGACAVTPEASDPERPAAEAVRRGGGQRDGNVLLIVLDDLATHQLETYGSRPDQPSTPTINALAAEGVLFQNAYAFASCTPGRAAMMTGRYPTRSGMGEAMDASADRTTLPLSEVTLPEMLKESRHGYTSALIGKWHLTSYSYPNARYAPNDHGFDWWQGSLEQLGSAISPVGVTNYTRWERITNGRPEIITDYATTVTANDVIAQTQALPEPWFITAAFNAPHTPLHAPPAALHSQDLTNITCGSLTDPDAGTCYNAMVEAVDTEIGRMLATIDPGVLSRTTVILTADNGTPEHGIFAPFSPDRDKGTLFDGGVRVPFIVAGPYVDSPGAVSQGFVSLVDLFATIAEIADVDIGTLDGWDGQPLVTDSVSFLDRVQNPNAVAQSPRDEYVYSELFFNNGAPPWHIQTYMVRTLEYKLIRERGVDAMYRYGFPQIDEGPNLLATAPPNYSLAPTNMEIVHMLEEVIATVTYDGP